MVKLTVIATAITIAGIAGSAYADINTGLKIKPESKSESNTGQTTLPKSSVVPLPSPIQTLPSQYLQQGALLQGLGPKVYLVQNGQRRWIPDELTFLALGYKWENIKKISEQELMVIPESSPLPKYVSKYRDGTLLRGAETKVYIISAGYRRLIPNTGTFDALGYRWEDVQAIPDQELAAIPELQPLSAKNDLTFKDGTLIKGSGTAVYVISIGRRRLIPDPQTFDALGYKWDQVKQIFDEQLNAIPQMKPLPALGN